MISANSRVLFLGINIVTIMWNVFFLIQYVWFVIFSLRWNKMEVLKKKVITLSIVWIRVHQRNERTHFFKLELQNNASYLYMEIYPKSWPGTILQHQHQLETQFLNVLRSNGQVQTYNVLITCPFKRFTSKLHLDINSIYIVKSILLQTDMSICLWSLLEYHGLSQSLNSV